MAMSKTFQKNYADRLQQRARRETDDSVAAVLKATDGKIRRLPSWHPNNKPETESAQAMHSRRRPVEAVASDAVAFQRTSAAANRLDANAPAPPPSLC